LTAARQYKIPVVMLDRPALPVADREFTGIEQLAEALLGNRPVSEERIVNAMRNFSG